MSRVCLGLAVALVCATATAAQTLRPRVTLVSPSGGQRGTTVDVTLTGVNLGYATQLLFETPSLSVESLTPDKPAANAKNPDGKLVAKIKIAPDAPLGRHPLRVVTPLGISDVGYLVVGEWPELAEKEPNNSRAQAQALTGPVTVIGRSDGGEDVDYYRLSLQKGEACTFAITAGSIGSAMEPVLVLQDSEGHELSFAASLSRPDASVHFNAPRTGEYFLSVRDLRYQGSPAHYYRLTLRKQEPPGLPPVPGGIVELEPNDLPKTAQSAPVPALITGALRSPASRLPDIDCFRFKATKGQALELEVLASRLGSKLDAVLTVLDSGGKELVSNDDARGRDPFLVFTPPDTAEYVARVSSLSGRSGDEFGYRLRVAPTQPDFQLTFAPDCLSVAPGDRVAVTVSTTRAYGFDGEIGLQFSGLPSGVQLLGTPLIVKGQNAVTLFATAAPGMPVSAMPLRITGVAGSLVRTAQPLEESYVKNGEQLQRNTKPVPFSLAGVTGPSDVLVTLATERIELKAGQTAEILVKLTRKEGFTAKVPLVIQGLPTGVSATNPEVPEKQSEHKLVLKAEGNAPPGAFSLVLYARVLVDELRFTDHATQPWVLNITK